MEEALALAREWRQYELIATTVAIIASPLAFLALWDGADWSPGAAIALTLLGVGAVRGALDILVNRFIPRPPLFGAEDRLAQADITGRRRIWFWKRLYRFVLLFGGLFIAISAIVALAKGVSLGDGISDVAGAPANAFGDQPPTFLIFQLFILFFINFAIIIGPLMLMGISQVKVYEPGDANWGVRLHDVRGQDEAKEEITKIVSLWQSGEEFVKAGGKRERGVLFLGAPGTGKTMLSKGIATSFNCPFVTIPGSGFAQMFLGMDTVLVRYLAWRAKKQAAKWGGQCIVFIDEIDAVGMRRQALGTGMGFAPEAAAPPENDVVVETEEWRRRQFEARAPEPRDVRPRFYQALGRLADRAAFIMPGMGGQGGTALNTLLVVMDGIDNPPFMKRFLVNRLNTLLDALYTVPRRVGKVKLRLPPAKPRKEEIYFIGATNVPLEMLDPALVRPGRMGRHVNFRTPTWEDRRDIFDLYINKVAHEAELDTAERRDEMARITAGYSPAMIDQICSMALTSAHSEGRQVFSWDDLVEAMMVVEAGVAVGQPYPEHEKRSVAIHEAGHAVCSHLYNEHLLSTRLTVRRRGDFGGLHQAMYIEDRFVNWRSEQIAGLIHTLGAMAAEYTFYGQTTTGVFSDLRSATYQASRMVAYSGMGPAPIELSDRITDPKEREFKEDQIRERFQRLGFQLLHRHDVQALEAAVQDRVKREIVAELLGQAFVVAFNTIRHNRAGVSHVADVLEDKVEMFGDEVVDVLDEAKLRKPSIDLLEEAAWPTI
jgi:ATP-dependent Zn protease